MTTEKECSGCGRVAAVGPDAAFCFKCGSALVDVQPPAPAPDPEPKKDDFGLRLRKGGVIGIIVPVGLVAWVVIISSVCVAFTDDEPSAPGRVSESQTGQPATNLCEHGDGASYLLQLRGLNSRFIVSASTLAELFVQMERTPQVQASAGFRRDVAESMARILAAARGIKALEAPDSFRQVDGLAKKMANELERAVQMQADGLEEGNGSKLEQGKLEVGKAIGYSNDMGDAIDKVCGRP